MEVFAFVFGDEFPQIQNADVTAEFREFSVRCTKVYGQSHYYYGAVFGNMEVSKPHKCFYLSMNDSIVVIPSTCRNLERRLNIVIVCWNTVSIVAHNRF